jgi:hypothetical protein
MSTDDLKVLRGIGPSTENRLHAAGIFTFAQLAELSPKELESMVSGLPEKSRLADWISEAKELASRAPRPGSTATAETTAPRATFRVELPLDEHGTVRGTHVTHLESGDEGSWPGFDEDHLVRFIARAATGPPTEVEQARDPRRREPVASAQEEANATEALGLSGVLRVQEIETFVADRPGRAEFLREGQPFTVRAVLDVTGLERRRDEPLSYTLGVYANGLVHGHRRIVGEKRGTTTLMTDEVVTIELEAAGLPKDLYRLTAFVTLKPVALEESAPLLAASVDEGPIQVA